MPPLKNKVLSRMATILARDLQVDAIIALFIGIAVFFIVVVAYTKWTEKR